MSEAVPALVAEFRAIMSDDGRGIPSADQCRAVIEHVASKLPPGPAIYAMWHVEHDADVARVCEFDGSKCYECAVRPDKVQKDADDLNLAGFSKSGRYVVALLPAGVGACIEGAGEVQAGGKAFPWDAGFDGGWTSLSAKLSDIELFTTHVAHWTN